MKLILGVLSGLFLAAMLIFAITIGSTILSGGVLGVAGGVALSMVVVYTGLAAIGFIKGVYSAYTKYDEMTFSDSIKEAYSFDGSLINSVIIVFSSPFLLLGAIIGFSTKAGVDAIGFMINKGHSSQTAEVIANDSFAITSPLSQLGDSLNSNSHTLSASLPHHAPLFTTAAAGEQIEDKPSLDKKSP